MNFDLSEEQQVIADLANQIFDGQVTVDRLKDAERGTGWDEALWADLATANITGLCLYAIMVCIKFYNNIITALTQF